MSEENEKVYLFKSTIYNTCEEDKCLKDFLREDVLEVNDLTEEDLIGDDFKTVCAREAVEGMVENRYANEDSMHLDDLTMNLKHVEYDGNDIIAFADLGFWNGRQTGYVVVGNEIKDIVQNFGCDYIKIFVDESDIDRKRGSLDVKFYGSHHDGSHYVTFRSLKDDVEIEDFDEIIFSGKPQDAMREEAKDWLRKNTKSIVSSVESAGIVNIGKAA